MAADNAPNGPFVLEANGHNAKVFRQMLASLTAGTSGVVNAGDMAVTANGTPNKTVNIAGGLAIIAGTEAADQGSYMVRNNASFSLDILTPHPADATNARIDLVVAKVQDGDYASGSTGPVNAWSLVSVTGTPSGSPSAPSAPPNSVVLAQVAIAANVTTIVSGNITDQRSTTKVTGPGTTLGYGQTQASTSAITSVIDLGVTATVVVGAGRRIKVTAFAAFQWTSGGTYPGADLYINEGGTTLTYAEISLPTNGSVQNTAFASTILQPSAGVHTYKLRVGAVGGATVVQNADASHPAYILVEDIGI
jgi:hypothetical protein